MEITLDGLQRLDVGNKRNIIDLDDANGFAETVVLLRQQIRSLSTFLESLVSAHEREIKRASDGTMCERRSNKLSTAQSLERESQSPKIQNAAATTLGLSSEKISSSTGMKSSTTLGRMQSSPAAPTRGLSRLHSMSVDSEPLSEHERVFVKGTDVEVQDLIRNSWDPNLVNLELKNVKVNKKHFLTTTPLVCAALRGRMDLVQWLIENSADPDSQYSFTAGASEVVWTGPCSHACVPSGNMVLLKTLFKLRADVNSRGSNGANLLWQAAYFNKGDMAQYLLTERCDIEARAVSQDNKSASHTPLHTAAFHGHAALVSVLLRGKASVDVYDHESNDADEGACSVLHDAIAHGHPDVAKLLIEQSADLFESIPHRKISRRTEFGAATVTVARVFSETRTQAGKEEGRWRLIDLVLELNNPIVIASVAAALEKTPGLLDHLNREDLVRFIRHSHGAAGYSIMNAVFRPYTIRYWEIGEDGRKTRAQRRTAFVNGHRFMNVALGPHNNFLVHGFNEKQQPSPEWRTFFEALLPEQPPHAGVDLFTSVKTLMCHVPDVLDLQVLLAIGDCESDKIFETPGCRAILSMAASEIRVLTRVQIAIALSVMEIVDLALLLLMFNIPWFRDRLSKIVGLLATGRFMIELIGWSLTAAGYFLQGLGRRLLQRVHIMMILLLYGVALGFTWDFTAKDEDDMSLLYRFALGAIFFIKCIQILFLACQFHSVGTRILPITSVFYDIGPFCVVMAFCVCGSLGMFFALEVREFLKSFLFIFMLILIGEFDGEEVQSEEAINNDQHYWVVVAVVAFVTFMMSLTLVNLFVAILNISYYSATEKAEVHFLRNRTSFLLDAHAVRRTLKQFTKCWRMTEKFCRRQSSGFNRAETLRVGALAQEESGCFLWLCLPDEKDQEL